MFVKIQIENIHKNKYRNHGAWCGCLNKHGCQTYRSSKPTVWACFAWVTHYTFPKPSKLWTLSGFTSMVGYALHEMAEPRTSLRIWIKHNRPVVLGLMFGKNNRSAQRIGLSILVCVCVCVCACACILRPTIVPFRCTVRSRYKYPSSVAAVL